MNDEQFRIGIEAAYKVAGQPVVIVGSQAILGSCVATVLPTRLTLSNEMDAAPVGLFDSPGSQDALDAVTRINVVVGEDSNFHIEHGFYVEGVHGQTVILADGWEHRLVAYYADLGRPSRTLLGWCLSAADICVAKTMAGREHDIAYVAELVNGGFVDGREAIRMLQGTLHWGAHEEDPRRVERALAFLEYVCRG